MNHGNIEDMDNRNQKQEKNVDPDEVKRLQKMGEKLHLVLRMAAMGLLEEPKTKCETRTEQETACGAEEKTLFDAYLALEEKYGEDWSALETALETAWTQEVIHMVLEPEKYTGVWRALRMRIISEALPLLRRFAGEEKTKEDSKAFTLLGLHVCDKVINTLARSDEGKP